MDATLNELRDGTTSPPVGLPIERFSDQASYGVMPEIDASNRGSTQILYRSNYRRAHSGPFVKCS